MRYPTFRPQIQSNTESGPKCLVSTFLRHALLSAEMRVRIVGLIDQDGVGEKRETGGMTANAEIVYIDLKIQENGAAEIDDNTEL